MLILLCLCFACSGSPSCVSYEAWRVGVFTNDGQGTALGSLESGKRNQVHKTLARLNPGATRRGNEEKTGLQINTFTWETERPESFFLPAVASRCTNPQRPLHRNAAVEKMPDAQEQNLSLCYTTLATKHRLALKKKKITPKNNFSKDPPGKMLIRTPEFLQVCLLS